MTDTTPPDRIADPLEAIEADEQRTADLLRGERPVPAPGFRGELSRRLRPQRRGGVQRAFGAFSARALAASYLGAGLVLLAVAAAGLAGAGPFGA
jgi:hypothetical protein